MGDQTNTLVICRRCEHPCGPTIYWVDGFPYCFVCCPDEEADRG